MSTDHHTPYPFGGPLTAVAMNAPLAELDAAITSASGSGAGMGHVSVVSKGAVGDGATNDLAAFIAAGAEAAATGAGGVVYVPDGTYLLGGRMEVPDGVTLLGQSKDGTVLQRGGTGVMDVPLVLGVRSRAENLTIDGAFDTLGDYVSNGELDLIGDDAVASGVCVRNYALFGVALRGKRSKLLASCVEGEGFGNKRPVGAAVTKFTATAASQTFTAVNDSGTPIPPMLQQGDEVNLLTGTLGGVTFDVDGAVRYVVKDVMPVVTTTVDAPAAAGQKVLPVASTVGMSAGTHLIIKDWDFTEEHVVVASVAAGVSVTLTVNLAWAHAAGIVVAGDGTHATGGFRIKGYYGEVITFTGNQVWPSYGTFIEGWQEGGGGGYQGIYPSGDDVVIDGCDISDNRGPAIFGPARRMRVTNNRIMGNHRMWRPMSGGQVAAVADCVIEGNTITGLAGAPITGSASTNLITCAGHGFVAGTQVVFPTLAGGAGLAKPRIIHHVIAGGLTADTFKVSTTPGGAEANFTTDITAGIVQATTNWSPAASGLELNGPSVVVGNTFEDIGAGSIVLQGADDSIISANRIISSGRNGDYNSAAIVVGLATPSTNVVVSGNSVQDHQTIKTTKYGVWVWAGCLDVNINGNDLTSCEVPINDQSTRTRQTYGNLPARVNSDRMVNVRDWGVQGDGVADDWEALFNVFASNPGKTVYFPAGVYSIGSRLSPAVGTRIIGDGPMQTILKRRNGTQAGIIYLNNPDCSIEQLGIDGSYDTLGKNTLQELEIGGDRSYGKHLRFSNWSNFACALYGNWTALSDTHFKGAYMVDPMVMSEEYGESMVGVNIFGGAYNRLDDITAEGCYTGGIGASSGTVGLIARGLFLKGNHMRHHLFGVPGYGGGQLNFNGTDITVSDCFIDGAGGGPNASGMEVDGTRVNISNVRIKDVTGYGIILQTGSDHVIRDCSFRNVAIGQDPVHHLAAVDVQSNIPGFSVIGCQVRDSGSPKTTQHGINVHTDTSAPFTTTTDGYLIVGNDLRGGYAVSGILDSAAPAPNKVIANNLV